MFRTSWGRIAPLAFAGGLAVVVLVGAVEQGRRHWQTIYPDEQHLVDLAQSQAGVRWSEWGEVQLVPKLRRQSDGRDVFVVELTIGAAGGGFEIAYLLGCGPRSAERALLSFTAPAGLSRAALKVRALSGDDWHTTWAGPVPLSDWAHGVDIALTSRAVMPDRLKMTGVALDQWCELAIQVQVEAGQGQRAEMVVGGLKLIPTPPPAAPAAAVALGLPPFTSTKGFPSVSRFGIEAHSDPSLDLRLAAALDAARPSFVALAVVPTLAGSLQAAAAAADLGTRWQHAAQTISSRGSDPVLVLGTQPPWWAAADRKDMETIVEALTAEGLPRPAWVVVEPWREGEPSWAADATHGVAAIVRQRGVGAVFLGGGELTTAWRRHGNTAATAPPWLFAGLAAQWVFDGSGWLERQAALANIRGLRGGKGPLFVRIDAPRLERPDDDAGSYPADWLAAISAALTLAGEGIESIALPSTAWPPDRRRGPRADLLVVAAGHLGRWFPVGGHWLAAPILPGAEAFGWRSADGSREHWAILNHLGERTLDLGSAADTSTLSIDETLQVFVDLREGKTIERGGTSIVAPRLTLPPTSLTLVAIVGERRPIREPSTPAPSNEWRGSLVTAGPDVRVRSGRPHLALAAQDAGPPADNLVPWFADSTPRHADSLTVHLELANLGKAHEHRVELAPPGGGTIGRLTGSALELTWRCSVADASLDVSLAHKDHDGPVVPSYRFTDWSRVIDGWRRVHIPLAELGDPDDVRGMVFRLWPGSAAEGRVVEIVIDNVGIVAAP